MKPGYRTTEFWLTLVATVLGAVAASGLLHQDSVAIKLIGIGSAVLASLGYTVVRGSVKKAGGGQ